MHRWTAPLLAALLVGGGTVGALALVGAAGFGQDVTAAPRHVGDRAEYVVTDENGTTLGRLRVEELAPFAARGGDGAWRAVEALRQTFVPNPAGTNSEDPDASAERIAEPWQGRDGADVGIRLAGGNQTYMAWTNRYNDVNVFVSDSNAQPNVFVAPESLVFDGMPAGTGAWCGLRNGAQGSSIAVRDGLAVRDCAADRLAWRGRSDAKGSVVHRFAAEGESVWVAEGLPYPIRVETDRADGRRILELVGFSPGAESPNLAEVSVPTSPEAPAVAFAPRTPTGPDAAGVVHPFPLATALERARTYTVPPGVPPFNDPSLTEFLQRHPLAQVAEAHYSEQTDTEWAVRTWEVAVVDGSTWAVGTIALEQREADAGPLAPATWSLTSPVRGDLQLRPEGPDGPWPPMERWPDTMPTVSSVLARWEAVKDPRFDGKAATGWGFRIACADEDCQQVETEVSAGRLRFQQPPDPLVQGPVGLPQGDTVDAAGQVLVVDGEGHELAQRSIYRRESPTDFSVVQLPGATSAAGAGQPAAAAWDLPPTHLAVGGALALAAALAALLWPALKGSGTGAAGLFSRIEGPRLLEHPGRAALVQAIEAEPGIHLRELARRTGQAEGALRHHLQKLQKAGLVVARPLNGYVCYFAPSAATDPSAAAAGAARSEGARQVLAAMRSGVTGVRAIAAATGLAPSTVSQHLARLREAGALPAADPSGPVEVP